MGVTETTTAETEDINLVIEKIAHQIWISEFQEHCLDPPLLKTMIEKEVVSLARRIIIACYLPSEKIVDNIEINISERGIFVPASDLDWFKSILNKHLPIIGKKISFKTKEIKTEMVKNYITYRIHPEFFNRQSSLSGLHIVRER